jgi:hypothetical protein
LSIVILNEVKNLVLILSVKARFFVAPLLRMTLM